MDINASQIAKREAERIYNAVMADDPLYSYEFKEMIRKNKITKDMIDKIAYSVACSIALMDSKDE